MIAPEYGTNTNHTGYIWTIDTTDPAKPFLLSKWKLPGSSILPDGTEHPHHYIPGGYIYSPHNGDTGTNGHVYWTHYHAGNWVTDHSDIWQDIKWAVPYTHRTLPTIYPLSTTVVYVSLETTKQTYTNNLLDTHKTLECTSLHKSRRNTIQ